MVKMLQPAKRKKIAKKVIESQKKRSISKKSLEIAKRGVEIAIEKSEAQAEKWITGKLNKLGVNL